MTIEHKFGHTKYLFKLSLANEVVVDVEVFRATGEDEGEHLLFQRKNAENGMDVTGSLDEAERVLEGDVKWDGCSNLNFFPDCGGNEHFCGKNSAIELGLVLSALYDDARELMGPEKVFDLDLYEN